MFDKCFDAIACIQVAGEKGIVRELGLISTSILAPDGRIMQLTNTQVCWMGVRRRRANQQWALPGSTCRQCSTGCRDCLSSCVRPRALLGLASSYRGVVLLGLKLLR